MITHKSDFDFTIPQQFIAQKPLIRRDHARLLIFDRNTHTIIHTIFKYLPSYLNPGDCLVLNTTQVVPARIFGKKITGGKIEVLLVREIGKGGWECLLKPGLTQGSYIFFNKNIKAHVVKKNSGRYEISVNSQKLFNQYIARKGYMPLPPYIKRKKVSKKILGLDRIYYQTVYAKQKGSIAAPTAGLHFTCALLKKLKAQGIKIAEVLLHVGVGTFKKITEPDIKNHSMEKEYFNIPKKSERIINETRNRGGRIIAVGTTVVRALESAALENGCIKAGDGWTEIFIYPGYRFKTINGMVTNFHLPKHPPFVMTSAFVGTQTLKKLYTEAINKNYRFYSYGDAMLII